MTLVARTKWCQRSLSHVRDTVFSPCNHSVAAGPEELREDDSRHSLWRSRATINLDVDAALTKAYLGTTSDLGPEQKRAIFSDTARKLFV